ncbi:hypothetical protein QBC45DRAFT_339987, partial [Copromyces sp. CBS 386.78]
LLEVRNNFISYVEVIILFNIKVENVWRFFKLVFFRWGFLISILLNGNLEFIGVFKEIINLLGILRYIIALYNLKTNRLNE